MKWQGRKKSGNVRDLRGNNPFGDSYRGTYGRKSMPIPGNRTGGSSRRGGAGLGCGSLFIILIMFLIFGGSSLFSGLGGNDNGSNNGSIWPTDGYQQEQGTDNTSIWPPGDLESQAPTSNPYETAGDSDSNQPSEDALFDFVSVVLADTEVLWSEIFRQNGMTYTEPKMVIFEDSVESACGAQSAQVGPFYCPADETIYIDLDFYSQLVNEYGGGGDFAMGYVVAHEVGHHVQNLLGVSDQVQAQSRYLSQKEQNEMTVRMELQADYLSGVWGRYIQENGWLEEGDIEEGLNAAYHIGDDVLQKKAYGRVMPDSFTHGTAEQRQRWFNRGLESGDLSGGDTFNIDYEDL